MANGIKLRRGLKASLGTIVEGELAYAHRQARHDNCYNNLL